MSLKLNRNIMRNMMSLKLIYPLLLADVGVLLWLVLSGEMELWQKATLGACTVVLMWLLWRGVVKPHRMTQIGMELLSAQDANNRLAPVGQPDADRIAKLFNTLMDRLHQERLRLREQNTFLDLLIQASPMGVAMMDFDYRLTHANNAFIRLAAIPEGTAIEGATLRQLPGDVAARISDLKDGETRTIRCEDHSILRCYRLSFMECGFRRPFILLESLTDEVMRAERSAYGKVIRLMAHEVNNSMTGITTLLDILASCHEADEDLSEFIASVADRCGAMGRFIGAYADVVRLPDPHPELMNLSDFITAQLPFLRSISSYSVETANLAPEAKVYADADMLSQTLVNIIKNSSEAIAEEGREDGRITLSVTDGGRQGVSLTVADNGCGISSETASNLFNPFFSTKPDGQGIGLTMVAEILRRHKARFSLHTDADHLTRFRITFPYHP